MPNMTVAMDTPSMMMTMPATVHEPANSTCNLTTSCLIEGYSAADIVSWAGYVYDSNPCTLLSTVYGCETDGCGCPYPECVDTSGCHGLQTCDKYVRC